MKTKNKKPKGIGPLIEALPDINETARPVSKILNGWGINQEIDDEDIEEIKKWLREAKTDEGRKIARCAVKCIYDNWVIPEK